MNALLICPTERAVSLLAEAAPLVLAPILGKPVLDYWLEDLAKAGADHVLILAQDRPEVIRAYVGGGERWGLQVEVIPESRELSVSQARMKYLPATPGAWLPNGLDAAVVDSLPRSEERSLFESYAEWFRQVVAHLEKSQPRRVGASEMQPGIWVGLRSQIAPTARLTAPCWIGEDVRVGAGVVLGPEAVLEDRVLIEESAEVRHSFVGRETYVGALTELRDSIAWGSGLANWRLGSVTRVPDAFLLSPLSRHLQARTFGSFWGRLAACFALLFSLPVLPLAFLFAVLKEEPLLTPRLAVRPSVSGRTHANETVVYYDWTQARGWLKRWPRLWNIVRGEFAWVGNQPLSPSEANALASDFERLWLAAPLGVISLCDAEGCREWFTDETKARASFYAVQSNWKMDLAILAQAGERGIKRALFAAEW